MNLRVAALIVAGGIFLTLSIRSVVVNDTGGTQIGFLMVGVCILWTWLQWSEK
jgi:hypothetical protein